MDPSTADHPAATSFSRRHLPRWWEVLPWLLGVGAFAWWLFTLARGA